MHTPLWIKIGMSLGFAYLAIFTIDLVGDMLGGSDGGHGEVEHVADASHAPEDAHPAAAVTHDDVAQATDHAGDAAPAAAVALVGDIAAGKKASKKCAACHSFDEGGPNKVGPNLFGLIARGHSATEGYKYSAALKAMSGSWNDGDLDAFLADPKAYAPGTKMSLKMRKAQDRADLIAYLHSLH